MNKKRSKLVNVFILVVLSIFGYIAAFGFSFLFIGIFSHDAWNIVYAPWLGIVGAILIPLAFYKKVMDIEDKTVSE